VLALPAIWLKNRPDENMSVALSDGGYTMDYTAMVHLMNSHALFVGVMNHQESEASARAKLQRLLDDERS
jgi:hypothetical protein